MNLMDGLNWQDLLNILTKKGINSGDLSNVKNSFDVNTKFLICYNHNKAFLEEWLEKKIKIDTKSALSSVELRLSGNSVYKNGNDTEALHFYNLSTAKAPHNTNDFALALSNRSAVLMRLNYFKDAIRDIDLALQHGNNDIPKTKLLIRKAILHYKLHSYDEVLKVVASLYHNEEDVRNHANVQLKDAYFYALEKKNEKNSELEITSTAHLPVPEGGYNGSFPSASAKISIVCSKEKGRHVVANDDLLTSDILFVEAPFALVVLPDQYKHHCHHCCKRVVAFIPCRECTRAQFCSEQCSEDAWSRYHRWECKGLDVCHSVGIAHLGLRVALLADTSQHYQQVYDLLTHIDSMNSDDIYQYAITAALLTTYLEQYTTYFTSHPTLSVDVMGGRILRHIAQLICNGHAITKIDLDSLNKKEAKTVTEEQVRIATAIYASASMMNHSCDQNISNNFINQCLVVTASRHIKKDEEVFNCYGPHHRTMNTEERQQVLQGQYFFTCQCPWCSEPSRKGYQQLSALQCQFCQGPVLPDSPHCADCHTVQPLTQLMDMALVAQQAFLKGKRLFETNDHTTTVELVEECVKLASKCLYKHNYDLRHYKDFLARTYVETGRYEEATRLVEDCINSVEAQFGGDSVEMSRELLKLDDLVHVTLETMSKNGNQNCDKYRSTLQKKQRLEQRIKITIKNDLTDNLTNKLTAL